MIYAYFYSLLRQTAPLFVSNRSVLRQIGCTKAPLFVSNRSALRQIGCTPDLQNGQIQKNSYKCYIFYMLKGIFGTKKSINSSEKTSVEEVVTRGVNEIFPKKEYLEKLLNSENKFSIYLGIDPTGPTLHLGHAIVLKKLQQIQSFGHKVILLIGDFTGMIGDPTDKSATRKKLSKEEVLENAKLYKKQASIFLNFDGDNPAEIKYNSKWLSSMNFGEVLELSSYMTVDQMLKRDMFEKRTKDGKPIYIHEFLYPLLQGYDSVALDIDGEIGGNDQMFNMLTGRTLMRQIKDKEKFVITTKLLEDSNGKKMGKTEGNMVTFLDTPTDMFGKVMSWTDGMIMPGFELCTNVSFDDLNEMEKDLKGDANPRDVKVRLAKEIVSIYHGENEAEKAFNNFEETFKMGGISDDAAEINAKKGDKISDALLNAKIISSKNELRRLVRDGAVTNITNGEKLKDTEEELKENGDYKLGKKKFVKIKVN
jgi:tyrosyl-tRNA synthetase